MERFHYSIKQKLEALDLIKAGDYFNFYRLYKNATDKQIQDWKKKEPEMRKLSVKDQTSKYIIHPGPEIKYKELYQFLYQEVKNLRAERVIITTEMLIHIAKEEEPEVMELSPKGQQSLIYRFMERFNLSLRTITSYNAFRLEQLDDDQLKIISTFRELQPFRKVSNVGSMTNNESFLMSLFYPTLF